MIPSELAKIASLRSTPSQSKAENPGKRPVALSWEGASCNCDHSRHRGHYERVV